MAPEKIAKITRMTRGRVTQIINNTSFGKINDLLTQGRDIESIAGHYNMDLALAWGLTIRKKDTSGKIQRTWMGTEHMRSMVF